MGSGFGLPNLPTVKEIMPTLAVVSVTYDVASVVGVHDFEFLHGALIDSPKDSHKHYQTPYNRNAKGHPPGKLFQELFIVATHRSKTEKL